MKRSTQIRRTIPTATLATSNNEIATTDHRDEMSSTNNENLKQPQIRPPRRTAYEESMENETTSFDDDDEQPAAANDEDNDFDFLKDNPGVLSLAERRKQFMMKGKQQIEAKNKSANLSEKMKQANFDDMQFSSSEKLEEEDYEESEIGIDFEKTPIKTVEKLADGENMSSLHEKLSSIIMDLNSDLSGSENEEETLPKPKYATRPVLKQSPQKKKSVLANRKPIIPQKRILQNQQIMQNQTPLIHVRDPDVSVLMKKPVNRLSKTPKNTHTVYSQKTADEQDENTLILGLSSDEEDIEIFEDLFDSEEFN